MSKELAEVLLLVSFRKELFPVRPEDYQALRSRGVTSYRMPKDLLPVIQHSLLKGMKIEIVSWSTVYARLIDEFEKSFPEGHEFMAEENWVMIHSEFSETEEKVVTSLIESRMSLLDNYMGRYGFKILGNPRERMKVRSKKGHAVTKLTFAPAPDRIPGFHFGSGETSDTETPFLFSLSPACRIRFLKRKSPTGKDSFTVVFEDKIGDQWAENTSRSFYFSYLEAKDCRAAVAFFSHMISLIEPSKRNQGA